MHCHAKALIYTDSISSKTLNSPVFLRFSTRRQASFFGEKMQKSTRLTGMFLVEGTANVKQVSKSKQPKKGKKAQNHCRYP